MLAFRALSNQDFKPLNWTMSVMTWGSACTKCFGFLFFLAVQLESVIKQILFRVTHITEMNEIISSFRFSID